ncbi:extracellular solute-binding protein [Auraticoccus sp. F435]|uniref:Extracellular solute-binding protein n=1 Tax=Auraticoccus cholistanensis TaxID=2656650 RepID=A0A6A9UZE0_9ACTN|nr:extracellular solute-binding protein [Auraticoccus cholistanensis]
MILNSTVSRRGVIAGGLAASAAVGLSACSGGSDTAAPGGGSTGPLQFFLSGDANQGGGFAAMAAKYQEQTGVTVEIIDIANDDLKTRLRNAAQADDLPALARVGAVDPVWSNAVVDLAEIQTAHGVDPQLSAVEEDGTVLSLPTDLTAVGLYLNKTLWDEAGVEYPTGPDGSWTWDEFVAAAREVKEAGARFGLVMDASSHRLKSFLYEFGSTMFQPGPDGTFTTNEATKTALEYFYELNDDEFMPRSVWLSQADGNALFKSGDVAAYYSGSWQIADFSKNIADFEWVSVVAPSQPVRAVQYGNAASLVVFEGEQSEAATAFVDWLFTKENYQELATISGFLPTVADVDVDYGENSEAFDLYNAEIAASAPIVAEIKALELSWEVQGLSTEGDPLRDEVVKYLNDEQTVDECIANVSALMTEAFSS